MGGSSFVGPPKPKVTRMGKCPVCRRMVTVRVSGVLARHALGVSNGFAYCDGAGQEPLARGEVSREP